MLQSFWHVVLIEKVLQFREVLLKDSLLSRLRIDPFPLGPDECSVNVDDPEGDSNLCYELQQVHGDNIPVEERRDAFHREKQRPQILARERHTFWRSARRHFLQRTMRFT